MYPRVSYSALDRFETCSMRQKLHAEKKRTPIKEEHVLVGNALHYGLAAHIDTFGKLRIVEPAMWEFERRAREEGPRWDRFKMEEQMQKVQDAAGRLQDLLDDRFRLVPPEMLRSEVRLFRAMKGWSIEGYLDLTVGTALEIWDLKTGSWSQDQLVFYDVLTETVLGSRPEVVGVIEPLGRGWIDLPVTDEHRNDMKERIKQFVFRVRQEDWQYEGYPDRCSWCNSKPFCPKWESSREGSFKILTTDA
jgi:hypothetical protein